MNVDEFEHTEVEQQARRDQQRVLTALARRNQEHVPMADVEHFDLHGPVGRASRALLMQAVDFCVATSAVTDSVTASPVEPTKRREHRRDPEVQREGNDVTQAAFQSPTAQDATETASDQATDTRQRKPSRNGTASTEQSITCEWAQSLDHPHGSPVKTSQ